MCPCKENLMASIGIELIKEMKANGASQRDIVYTACNIPQEFWDIARDEIEVNQNNSDVYKYVIDYVDNIHTRIAEGKGLSLLGLKKSGKTLFGCAILKSAAINPETLRREYSIIRVNYDTILEDFIHIRNEQDTYMELKNALVRANILFLDSISYTNPSSVLLSIMRTRRDYKKSTILATSIEPKLLSGVKSKELFDIFDDVNHTYLVKRK
jgi:DNA replication protein DnaC